MRVRSRPAHPCYPRTDPPGGGQRKNLITVGGLQDAQQRLGVEAVGHDREFRDGPLQPVDAEHRGRAQHGEPFQRVVLEVVIIRQRLQWCDQRLHVAHPIAVAQGRDQRLDQIAEPDRILLIVRMLSMGRLLERQAGWLLFAEQQRRIVVFKQVHLDPRVLDSRIITMLHLDSATRNRGPHARCCRGVRFVRTDRAITRRATWARTWTKSR